MKRLVLTVCVSAVFATAAAAQWGAAKSMIQRNEDDKAIAEITRILKDDPNNSNAIEGYQLLGNLYYKKSQAAHRAEDYIKAKEAYAKVLEINTNDNNAKLMKIQAENGIRGMWVVVFNDGITFFNNAISEKEDSKKNALLDSAGMKFKLATDLCPDSAQPYDPLARTYIVQKKYPEAEAALKKYISKKPTDTLAYLQLGSLYADRMHDANKAIEVFEGAVSNGYGSSEILTRLIVAYAQGGRMKDAEKLLDKAVATAPEKDKKRVIDLAGNVRRLIGRALQDSSRYEEAIAEYKEAAKLAPTNSDIAYDIAYCYVRLARAKKQTFEDSVKAVYAKDKKKKNARIPDYTEGKPYYQKALEVLKPAAERENKKMYWRLLATVYANLDMNAESKDALDKEKTGKEE